MADDTLSPRRTILVVDDQAAVCYSLRRLLETQGYSVFTAESGEEGLRLAESEQVALVLMDVRMPGIDGLATLQKMKSLRPDLQVIMMTAFSSTEKAIDAMRLGAYDYILKPFENEELLARIREALQAREVMTEVVRLESDDSEYVTDRVVGRSSAMIAIFKQIGTIAPTDTTVILKGESGTGKDLIARAIYHYSGRSGKPFLAMNCSAIPEQLLESELFGFERGAFTGAEFRRLGKFEQCNGGTLLLDEVCDMPLTLQSKVLRVLQDGVIQRLGGSEEIRTDVRLLAATNKNMQEMVANGAFREDLYYRLNVISIDLPPLRERREDIKELVAYFISRYNKKLGRNVKGVSSILLQECEGYPWPGNVRELENFIQKSMVFCRGEFLTDECFDLHASHKDRSLSMDEIITGLVNQIFRDGHHGDFQTVVSTIERSIIKRALELTKGNQVHASRLLGISRTTLRKKIEET